MTVSAVITLPATDFALGEVLNETGVRIELPQFVVIADSLVPYLWVNDADHDQETFIEQANTLSREEQVDERAPAAAAIGTGTDVWRFQLRAPERDTLAAFYDACSGQGMELAIQQIVSSRERSERGQWNLTEKQHEALIAAYDKGYFAVPRTTSLADLADEFGISHQAFSRRLMRGMNSLLTHTLVVESEFFDRE